MKRLGLSVDEYCTITGASRNAVYAAVKSGDIPSIRIGTRIVIPRYMVEATFGPIVLHDDPEEPAVERPRLEVAE